VAASVGGKLGQIGGRLIDSSAKKMADEFFAALRQQISEDGRAAAGAADEAAADEPAHEPNMPPDLRVPQEQIDEQAGAPRQVQPTSSYAGASASHGPASPTRTADAFPATATALPAPLAPSAWPGGRLMPELYRVGWFALGVVTTLLLTHLS